MDKDKLLNFVYLLQNLREDIDTILYTSPLPIDHLRVNFNDGFDRSLEAILAAYGEAVLDDIQREKKANNE